MEPIPSFTIVVEPLAGEPHKYRVVGETRRGDKLTSLDVTTTAYGPVDLVEEVQSMTQAMIVEAQRLAQQVPGIVAVLPTADQTCLTCSRSPAQHLGQRHPFEILFAPF